MEPKNRVEALRVERGNLEELSSEERIERAIGSIKSYLLEIGRPLISRAEVKDYSEACEETLASLPPDEFEVVSARLQPFMQDWSLQMAESREARTIRKIFMDEMRGVPPREIIERVGGLEQLERLVGTEETERLRKEAEKEE